VTTLAVNRTAIPGFEVADLGVEAIDTSNKANESKPQKSTDGQIQVPEAKDEGERIETTDNAVLNEANANRDPGSAKRWEISPKPWDFKARSPFVKKIEMALRRSTEVTFNDAPLQDAIDYLEDLHQIEIYIDKAKLAEQGISSDQTVTLVVTGVSLRSVLQLILPPVHLDYVIKNDALIITTPTDADETYETRVYDLRRIPDLIPKELVEIITATVEPVKWAQGEAARAVETVTETTEPLYRPVMSRSLPRPRERNRPHPTEWEEDRDLN